MSFISRRAAIAVLSFLAAFAGAASARAADVVVLLDGSRSSSVPIGGTSKLNIARQSLAAVLDGAPAEFRIGIAVYGLIADSCTPSSYGVLAPPGTPAAAINAAGDVTPTGRGPIAEAAANAAEAFADPNAPGTIIIVTDNADNCAPDPCATISALHDRMPNLTISILGLGVPQDEVAELACFTELTGGQFLAAANATTFRANMQQLLETAWAIPTPPPEPLPTATITVPADVVQGQPFAVTYEGPLAPGDQIRISWYGTAPAARLVGAFVREDGGPVLLTAPVERGAYEIRYWHAERQMVLASTRLLVGPIPATIDAPETVQQGATFQVTWAAPIENGETLQIAEAFAPLDNPLSEIALRRTEHVVTLTAPVLAGRYEIRLVLPAPEPLPDGAAIRGPVESRVLATRTIDVVAARATLATTGPVVAGSRFSVDWTGPGGGADEIRLARRDMAASDSIDVRSPVGTTVTFTAPFPAGVYELRYWSAVLSTIVAKALVDVVQPQATLDATAELQAGATFEVVWTGPANPGDRVVIARADAPDGETLATVRVSSLGRPAVFDAPGVGGAYELRYLAGMEGAVIARRAVTVLVPAVTMTVNGPVAAGAAFEVTWIGPAGRYDEIRLTRPLDDADRPIAAVRVTAGTVATLMAPAEPGVYVLSYWAGSSGLALAATSIEVRCDACPPAPAAAGGAVPLRP